MTKRVLVHVGTPKTGTSYLQDVLHRNRERLVGHGIHYPADRFDAHFLAALDLMKLPWGGLEAEAIGAWERLAAAVREAPDGDTVIVSHEILAHASRQQADLALDSFGEGCEVHVFLSVRDLARQIPAEWQENVKHRATLTYAEFLRRIQDPARETNVGSWFWAVQELPDILDRWGHRLPPEHVHLITVPPSGSDRTLLWKRFSQAFGLDGLDLDLTAERANPSLGVPETALLRRINLKANGVVEPADYRPLVRELLAHRVLSKRRGTPRLALPPEVAPWAEELSRRWVEELRSRGYDVVGSLDELVGAPGDPAAYADPDRPRPRQVAAASVDVIEALLVESSRARREERRLHEEVAALREANHRLEESRLRRRVYLRLERSLAGRALLRVYRLARGRSSRAA